jgi:hypothetical protein
VKKSVLAAFAILALCSLLMTNIVAVKADPDSGYTRTDWPTQRLPTIDGEWTTTDEWTDTEFTTIDSEAAFGSTWDSADAGVYTRWLIEVFNDTTDDPADYVEMCLDNANSGGADLGGAGTYYRIYITGDGTLTLYQGSGSGWSEITPSADPADITFATTISASENVTTAHRIWEIDILKSAGTGLLSIEWGVRVALYDDDTGTTLVWPPDAERDVPDDWATNGYSTTAWVPEGFSIAIVVLLSSAAVAACLILRKHPKMASCSVGKTGVK